MGFDQRAFAHSPNESERWHLLVDHLTGTSTRAADFAARFGGADAARAIGLLHDIGKVHPEWQQYLHASTANPALRGTGPEHKLAGALIAARTPGIDPLCLAIAGHHGGMPSAAGFRSTVSTDLDDVDAAEEAIELARATLPPFADFMDSGSEGIPAEVMGRGRTSIEHFIRMVFSALVDADFLDTEAHFHAARVRGRERTDTPIDELLARFLAHTDVAIKRKVRDYVDIALGEEQRFKIYVQHGQYLTDTRARVFADRAEGRADKDVRTSEARDWMCDEFFDVRMFGAVMSMSEKNAGQVRGPLQLTFARSIDPILALDEAIVGPAQNQKQARRNDDDETDRFGTMGRKTLIPYGLYRGHGFFNPHFAKATGVTSEDLDLFWNALIMMWDHARSSSKGLMSCRGVYVFTHEHPLGNAPAQTLFERLDVRRRDGDRPVRAFTDYEVSVDETSLPAGITLTRLGC